MTRLFRPELLLQSQTPLSSDEFSHFARYASDEERRSLEHMTKSIVNKLLHAPVARLRAETDREEGMAMREAARALFGLDDLDTNDDNGEVDE